MDTINIQKENVIKAYNNSNEEQKKMLETIFGKELFKPRDITERIKTFTDACRELGDKHPYVLQWAACETVFIGNKQTADFIAYLKLRIITAALNEGWEPQFTKGERRWYYWYDFITKEQYDKLDDKSRAVLRSGNYAYANGGLVYAFAGSASSSSSASYGSRLAFKSEKLAEYAAKQFIEIYADFCFRPEEKAK